MSQERLSMRKIREVLRLKWDKNLSNRAIARSCRISHSTVSEYVKRASVAGLEWPLPEELDEEHLYLRLFPETQTMHSKATQVVPDWEQTRTGVEEAQCDLAPAVGGISRSPPGGLWLQPIL